MAGFYEVTKNDKSRTVVFHRVSHIHASPTAVFLSDAAETKLPTAQDTMPFADLVTYDPAFVPASFFVFTYDADKGPSVINTVGQTQYSADGETWADTIPNGVMVAGQSVDFYIRTNPTTLARPDDGSYVYMFLMQTVGAGGLSLINVDRNKAHIFGTTPADQQGLTFSVNTTVRDFGAKEVTGTALTKVWA